MKIFMLENVEGIGKKGEVVKVNEGYARNYLLPKKLCIEYSRHTQEIINTKIMQTQEKKEKKARRSNQGTGKSVQKRRLFQAPSAGPIQPRFHYSPSE